MPRALILAAASLVAGCAAASSPAPPQRATPRSAPVPSEPAPTPAPEAAATLVLDRAAADRLLGASGVTLQWIDWNTRGPVAVTEAGGTIRLTASQRQAGGPGGLFLDGEVREIGADYFVFDGVIRIAETPDAGRFCEADKLWHFAITQNRRYWRLREFEWCDGLTDYIDIYF